ncbi:hypothetical protein MR626_10615 [bacterium]|nr:hypothetical protein [bacterium]
MQENNNLSLLEMLEQLPTSQLSEMMRQELRKETPDKNAVKLILSILEMREENVPELDAQTQAAWDRYQQRVESGSLRPKSSKNRLLVRWVVSAAVIAVALLFLVPQRADAAGFWGLLNRWRNSILEFFTPDERISDLENAFETDNPGLQKVYDAVLEMGVEDPLVPSWLPENSVLSAFEEINTPVANRILSEFVIGENKAVLIVDSYSEMTFHGYCGDGINYDSYEKEGATYIIAHNEDKWVSVWTKDNAEYSLSIDCQEETLRRILTSIYEMEES